MDEITLINFICKTFLQQLDIIKSKAVFLDSLCYKSWTFFLYQVHSFYVEISVDSLDNEIKKIRTFEDTDSLELYLNKIDLGELKSLNY